MLALLKKLPDTTPTLGLNAGLDALVSRKLLVPGGTPSNACPVSEQ